MVFVNGAQTTAQPCVTSQLPHVQAAFARATKLSSQSELFVPRHMALYSDAPGKSTKASVTPAAATTSDDVEENASGENFSYEGELPSIGSAGHADGSCKRCAFFPKGRCKNGADCTHCHFPHMPRVRPRKRVSRRQDGAAEEMEEGDDDDNRIADEVDVESDGLSEFPPLQRSAQVQDHIEEPHDLNNVGNAIAEDSGVEKHAQIQVVDVPKSPPTIELLAGLDCNPARDDVTELETTDPSVSAASDCDESVAFGFPESTRTLVRKESTSESSDADVGTPTSTAESKKSGGLASSPASWMAQQREKKALGIRKELSASDIGRMARAVLNKLTEERFELLATQMLALPLTKAEQLDAVAAELFEKATTEDCFRKMYAELCTRLDTHLASQTGAVGGKAFRKALVSECQATFERTRQPPEAALFADMPDDERLEVEIKLKTRRLGNMRFIGELLARRLLAPKLLPPIVHELLNGDAAAAEDLIALLTVVAPHFEQKASLVQAPLKDAFATLKQKSIAKGTSTRLKCQITDLLEARTRGWAPRPAHV